MLTVLQALFHQHIFSDLAKKVTEIVAAKVGPKSQIDV